MLGPAPVVETPAMIQMRTSVETVFAGVPGVMELGEVPPDPTPIPRNEIGMIYSIPKSVVENLALMPVWTTSDVPIQPGDRAATVAKFLSASNATTFF